MKKSKSLQQQFEDAYRKSRNLTDDEAKYAFRFSDDVYNDPFVQARWEGYQLRESENWVKVPPEMVKKGNG